MVWEWSKTLIHLEQHGLNCPNVVSYTKRNKCLYGLANELAPIYLILSLFYGSNLLDSLPIGGWEMNLAWNPHGTILTLVVLNEDCFGHDSICIVHVLLDIHESYTKVEPRTQQIMWNTHMPIHKSIILKGQSEGHKRSIITNMVALKKKKRRCTLQCTNNKPICMGAHLVWYMLKCNK